LIKRPKRKCSIQPIIDGNCEDEGPARKFKPSSPAPPNTSRKSCPLRISAPEEGSCKLSDNLADSCRTFCKVCGISYPLSAMRMHTISKHDLQITRYKELYGLFEIIEQVFHKCHICGKIVLLDNDALGGHIKSTHKMKEKDYKERFMTYANKSSSKVESQPSKIPDEKSKKVGSKQPQFDFKTTFPDFEYSCNLKHCELCEHEGVAVLLDTIDSKVKTEVESEVKLEVDIEKTSESFSVAKQEFLSANEVEEPLPPVECKLGQGGWSKKFLPTDILASGYLRDDLEEFEVEDEFFDSESIDYSDESLLEESEDTSESSEDDSDGELEEDV